jgi:hypothetical protein
MASGVAHLRSSLRDGGCSSRNLIDRSHVEDCLNYVAEETCPHYDRCFAEEESSGKTMCSLTPTLDNLLCARIAASLQLLAPSFSGASYMHPSNHLTSHRASTARSTSASANEEQKGFSNQNPSPHFRPASQQPRSDTRDVPAVGQNVVVNTRMSRQKWFGATQPSDQHLGP